jgi:hypothetical protein
LTVFSPQSYQPNTGGYQLKQTRTIKNRVDSNIRDRHWKTEKKGALTFLAGAGVYTIDARRE